MNTLIRVTLRERQLTIVSMPSDTKYNFDPDLAVKAAFCGSWRSNM